MHVRLCGLNDSLIESNIRNRLQVIYIYYISSYMEHPHVHLPYIYILYIYIYIKMILKIFNLKKGIGIKKVN